MTFDTHKAKAFPVFDGYNAVLYYTMVCLSAVYSTLTGR